MENTYWLWVEDCSFFFYPLYGSVQFPRSDWGQRPSVILRGTDMDGGKGGVNSVYLVYFSRVIFTGGGVQYILRPTFARLISRDLMHILRRTLCAARHTHTHAHAHTHTHTYIYIKCHFNCICIFVFIRTNFSSAQVDSLPLVDSSAVSPGARKVDKQSVVLPLPVLVKSFEGSPQEAALKFQQSSAGS